jgi:hypothetical protein
VACRIGSDEAAFPRFRWRTMLPTLVMLALAVHALLPQLATLQATVEVLRRQPLFGAVANAGFDVVTLFYLFIATRQVIAPPALIAGYGLPQLVGRLTFLPDGLGITEGGMVGLYVRSVCLRRRLSWWSSRIADSPSGCRPSSGFRSRRCCNTSRRPIDRRVVRAPISTEGTMTEPFRSSKPHASDADVVTLFLCGDVMIGRGVDQIMSRSCAPRIFEKVRRSAVEYVDLAERAYGPIPRPVSHAYVWGVALDVLDDKQPVARIVNLETSVTTSEDALPKGINYRMHPANVAVLSAARIDCVALANNHVLDWGEAGLVETLESLAIAGIPVAGAGRTIADAETPAVLARPNDSRVLVFGLGGPDSGIPRQWSATSTRAGVYRLSDYSDATVEQVARLVTQVKRRGDVVLTSIHWGGTGVTTSRSSIDGSRTA